MTVNCCFYNSFYGLNKHVSHRASEMFLGFFVLWTEASSKQLHTVRHQRHFQIVGGWCQWLDILGFTDQMSTCGKLCHWQRWYKVISCTNLWTLVKLETFLADIWRQFYLSVSFISPFRVEQLKLQPQHSQISEHVCGCTVAVKLFKK